MIGTERPDKVVTFSWVDKGDTLRLNTSEMYGSVLTLSEYTTTKGCNNGCRIDIVRRKIELDQYKVIIPKEGFYGIEIDGENIYCTNSDN